MDKEYYFQRIMDDVAYYCDETWEFDHIINNIKQMKENFEEEHEEDKDEDPVCYVKPWEKY